MFKPRPWAEFNLGNEVSQGSEKRYSFSGLPLALTDAAQTKSTYLRAIAMSASQPQKLFGTTNELAKERNRAAAERTINAWIGNCITLIGFGVALDQISRSLRQRFPDVDPLMTEAATHLTSQLLTAVGLVLLLIALMQHRLEIKTIEQADYVWLSINALNRVVVTAILLMGFSGMFAIIFLL
jgi:putative membrane protein